jgi:uncharacterized Zn-finger protein
MKAISTPSESNVRTSEALFETRLRPRAAHPYHFKRRAAMVAARSDPSKADAMSASVVPHLANDQGVEKIFIGVRELNCMGARPPFDHPHVYLDMGDDGQILCPYCSTLYIHDPRLSPDQSDPVGCLVSLVEDFT